MTIRKAVAEWWPFRHKIQSVCVGVIFDKDLWGWSGDAHKGYLYLTFGCFMLEVGG